MGKLKNLFNLQRYREMPGKKKAIIFIAFFTLVLTGAMIPSKFAVSLTESLGYRVFYLDKASDSLKRGDYVIVYLTSEHINDGKPVKAIKQVACSEGETLIVVNKDYYCIGQKLEGQELENIRESLANRLPLDVPPHYIGRAKDYSLKGERLKHFEYNGVIPEGYIFVAAPHRDSFDSRYCGFLDRREVISKAYPVF